MKKIKTILLFLTILSAPFYSFALMNINNRAIEFSWAFAGLLILLFFAELAIGKKRLFINKIGMAIIALNCTAILSLIGIFGSSSSDCIIDFLTTYIQILLAALSFFAITSIDVQWQQVFRLFRAWILIALLIAIYGIYQLPALIFDLPFAKPPITNLSRSVGGISAEAYLSAYGLARSTSIFPEPSALGSFLLGPILLMSITLFRQIGGSVFFRSKVVNYVIFFIFILAFFFAFSLGAFVALLATVILFFLKYKYRGHLLRWGFKHLLALFMLLLLVNCSIIKLHGVNYGEIVFARLKGLTHQIASSIGISIERSTEGPGTSYFRRLDIILAGLSVWAKYPLFGVGLNNFGNVAGDFMWTATPIQILADQGILGFSAYLFFFWAVFKSLSGGRKKAMRINTKRLSLTVQNLLMGLFYVAWSQFFFFFFGDTWFLFNQFAYFALAGLLVNKIYREKLASDINGRECV